MGALDAETLETGDAGEPTRFKPSTAFLPEETICELERRDFIAWRNEGTGKVAFWIVASGIFGVRGGIWAEAKVVDTAEETPPPLTISGLVRNADK